MEIDYFRILPFIFLGIVVLGVLWFIGWSFIEYVIKEWSKKRKRKNGR